MNFPPQSQVEEIRLSYPADTRVELVSMDDPYTNLQPGDMGTVKLVDDTGSIHVSWDKGSSRAVVYGVDIVKIHK